MTETEKTPPFAMRSLLILAAVVAALIYANASGDLMRALIPRSWTGDVPYARSMIRTAGDIMVMVALVALAGRVSPVRVLGLTGLGAPVRRPLLWAALWFVPALVVCVVFARLASDLSWADFAWKAIGGPITEELFFRGLAVGVLMRLCGWSVWPACVLPALCFGAAHIYQGSDWETIGGVVAITTLGGLVFGWLFVRWNFNLWPPILLHAGLNGLWLVFDLGETAIGGWLGNGMRIAVLVVALATTFWLAPKRAPKVQSP
ncbi:MAG: CPBP family intramembrane glutamic endopeptidase [Hyphomonadaceae bacterium]